MRQRQHHHQQQRRRDHAAAPRARGATAIKHNDANAKTTLTVGSKNFTEQKVLGEIYAQAFEAAGYTVKKALNLGDEKTALKAVKTDQISGYPEYTGTALLSFLKVPAKDIPTDERQAFDQVKTGLAKQGIEASRPRRSRRPTRSACSRRRPPSSGSRRSPTSSPRPASSRSTARRSAARAWTACSASRRSTG
jgi:hypothetical protein